MTQRSLFVLFALATSPLAQAQTVLFSEDFSNGFGAWNLESNDGAVVFHLLEETDPCGGAIAPFPSSRTAARAGYPAACNFNAGSHPGCRMTTKTPIDLPLTSDDIYLTFWSYDSVECDSCGWDWRFVYVSDDGGQTWDFGGESDRRYQWYTKALDLTKYTGKSILLRFDFDAVDSKMNSGLGWVIDDIQVVVDPWAPPTNYCAAATHSEGGPASMGWGGSYSVKQNDFVLKVAAAPKKQFAYFFYGPAETYVPVADGYLCVGPGATGMVRLVPPAQIDDAGALEIPLDIDASLQSGAWITPGSTYCFQCWFRDPAGGPIGSNFSDGLRVVFKP